VDESVEVELGNDVKEGVRLGVTEGEEVEDGILVVVEGGRLRSGAAIVELI
jgi:hypothetical protein